MAATTTRCTLTAASSPSSSCGAPWSISATPLRNSAWTPTEGSAGAIYIIRNSQIDAAPEQVRPRLQNIAYRSMMTVLKAVAMGDMVRIWTLADRDGVGFYYVGIPADQPEAAAGGFDPEDMRRLFDLGASMALEPEPWRSDPPAFIRFR